MILSGKKKLSGKVTFSLTMLRDKIQMLLNFCSPAPVPTVWNVQLDKINLYINQLTKENNKH